MTLDHIRNGGFKAVSPRRYRFQFDVDDQLRPNSFKHFVERRDLFTTNCGEKWLPASNALIALKSRSRTGPVPLVVCSSVRLWITTGISSLVRDVSSSMPSAPISRARAKAASVFSGAEKTGPAVSNHQRGEGIELVKCCGQHTRHYGISSGSPT